MAKQASLVFEADIPAHMRRGCAATMMVVLTESQSSINQVSVDDSKQSESQSSSNNTLQVPDCAYQGKEFCTSFCFAFRFSNKGGKLVMWWA